MRHDVMGIGGLAHLKGETGPQLGRAPWTTPSFRPVWSPALWRDGPQSSMGKYTLGCRRVRGPRLYLLVLAAALLGGSAGSRGGACAIAPAAPEAP